MEVGFIPIPRFNEQALCCQNRISFFPFFKELRGDVFGRVVLGVAVHAHGLELEESRSLTGTCSRDPALGRQIDGRDVVPIHNFPRHPVRPSPLNNVGNRHL